MPDRLRTVAGNGIGPTGFDWPALMRAGMAGAGLRPAEFWALTPFELVLLVGPAGVPPLGRRRLDELAAAFPDATANDGGCNGG